MVHPRYLFGAIEPSKYETYKVLNYQRSLKTYKAMSSMMTENSLVKIKEHPPYAKEMENPVLLNSLARAKWDAKTGEYSFPKKLKTEVEPNAPNLQTIVSSFEQGQSTAGVGVDHGKKP